MRRWQRHVQRRTGSECVPVVGVEPRQGLHQRLVLVHRLHPHRPRAAEFLYRTHLRRRQAPPVRTWRVVACPSSDAHRGHTPFPALATAPTTAFFVPPPRSWQHLGDGRVMRLQSENRPSKPLPREQSAQACHPKFPSFAEVQHEPSACTLWAAAAVRRERHALQPFPPPPRIAATHHANGEREQQEACGADGGVAPRRAAGYLVQQPVARRIRAHPHRALRTSGAATVGEDCCGDRRPGGFLRRELVSCS